MSPIDLLVAVRPTDKSQLPPSGRGLVVVPAYNEQAAIASTLRSLRCDAPGWDVVVVNDGSHDATSQAARVTGIATVLDLPCNLGIGGAVQTGFKYAERYGYDVALQFDGDGQHQADQIGKLLAPLAADEADVVIGSRFIDAQDGSFRSTFARRLGIFAFYKLNSWLIGQPITDNTSGFRAYNRRAIAFLAEHYPTDYPEPEAIILLARNGFRLKEVPVTMRERQGGISSITYMIGVYYMIKVMLAVVMTGLRPPLAWPPERE